MKIWFPGNAKETGAKKRITVGMSEEAEQEPTYDSDGIPLAPIMFYKRSVETSLF